MFIFYYIISNGLVDKKEQFSITIEKNEYSGKIN